MRERTDGRGGGHAPDPPESANGPPAFPASDGGRGFPKRYGIETAFLMGVTPRGSLPAMIAAISPPTLSRASRTGRSVRSRQETVDGEADPERGDQDGQHRAVASRSERAASLCAMSARSLSHTIRIVRREADTFLDQTLIFPIFNSQECALPCQQPSTNSILPSWTICYFLPDPRSRVCPACSATALYDITRPFGMERSTSMMNAYGWLRFPLAPGAEMLFNSVGDVAEDMGRLDRP